MKSVFTKDLEVGKTYENKVLHIIQKKYPKAYIIDGYCKEWDIYIPELEKGVEVKSDRKSLYTGNIVIEIEFDGKPSALITTKADWWVIYDGIKYNWFTVNNIKKCIKENNLRSKRFVGRGDTKEKKAYLIKKEILYKYRENETRR
jgi:hypothetical protein|tara:strand:- start:200 stop:637 length:438 start_codon:yes stop_codon:yes gene_type:complete